MCQNEGFSESFEMCVQEMKDIEKGLLLLLEGWKMEWKCGCFLSKEKKSFCEQQGKRRWMKKVVVEKINSL